MGRGATRWASNFPTEPGSAYRSMEDSGLATARLEDLRVWPGGDAPPTGDLPLLVPPPSVAPHHVTTPGPQGATSAIAPVEAG